MGVDKASIEIAGITLAQRGINALRDLGCDPVVQVGGATTVSDGAIIADWWPGEGPVAAVATALQHVRSSDYVLTLPCDLPGVNASALRCLTEDLTADRVLVGSLSGRSAPPIACWPSSIAAVLQRHVEGGIRSFHALFDHLATEGYTIVAVELDAALADADRPEDLPGAPILATRVPDPEERQ